MVVLATGALHVLTRTHVQARRQLHHSSPNASACAYVRSASTSPILSPRGDGSVNGTDVPMMEENTPARDAAPSTQATGTTSLLPNNLFGTPGLSSSAAIPMSSDTKDANKEVGDATLEPEMDEEEEGEDEEENPMDEEELTGHMASLAMDSAGASLQAKRASLEQLKATQAAELARAEQEIAAAEALQARQLEEAAATKKPSGAPKANYAPVRNPVLQAELEKLAATPPSAEIDSDEVVNIYRKGVHCRITIPALERRKKREIAQAKEFIQVWEQNASADDTEADEAYWVATRMLEIAKYGGKHLEKFYENYDAAVQHAKTTGDSTHSKALLETAYAYVQDGISLLEQRKHVEETLRNKTAELARNVLAQQAAEEKHYIERRKDELALYRSRQAQAELSKSLNTALAHFQPAQSNASRDKSDVKLDKFDEAKRDTLQAWLRQANEVLKDRGIAEERQVRFVALHGLSPKLKDIVLSWIEEQTRTGSLHFVPWAMFVDYMNGRFQDITELEALAASLSIGRYRQGDAESTRDYFHRYCRDISAVQYRFPERVPKGSDKCWTWLEGLKSEELKRTLFWKAGVEPQERETDFDKVVSKAIQQTDQFPSSFGEPRKKSFDPQPGNGSKQPYKKRGNQSLGRHNNGAPSSSKGPSNKTWTNEKGNMKRKPTTGSSHEPPKQKPAIVKKPLHDPCPICHWPNHDKANCNNKNVTGPRLEAIRKEAAKCAADPAAYMKEKREKQKQNKRQGNA